MSTDLGPEGPDPARTCSGDATPDEQLALTADWGSSRRMRAAGPRLGPVGWLRWVWRQLTSMRTALVLLLLLALAAIPGSILPQRPNDPLAVNAWIERNPGTAPTLDRLEPLRRLLLAVVRGGVPAAVRLADRLRPAPRGRALALDAGPDPARAPPARPAAGCPDVDHRRPGASSRPRRRPCRSERWRVTPGADSLAAEKGFTRETGNLLFHVALVLVLVGVALGALFGWKGTVIVREGNGFANTLTQYDSFSPGRLASPDRLPPFAFTMSDFEATFEREGSQRGAPRSFAATLQYSAEPGAPVEERVVSVNAPLRVDGAKVFLVGHGYAPHLKVTDSTGRVVFDDTVVFLPQDGSFTSTGVVKAPDGQPQLGIQALFAPTAALDAVQGPHSTFPAPDDPAMFFSVWSGDLGLDAGTPRNVFSLDTEGLEQLGLAALRPGESWEIPDGQGTVEFVGLDRWASFTISRDPGKALALAAAIAAIVGLCLSLFVRRRRIWVRVDPVPADTPPGSDGNGSLGLFRVHVAGLTRSDSADVSGEVEQLVTRLGGPAQMEEGT